jgi:hypothetical protein
VAEEAELRGAANAATTARFNAANDMIRAMERSSFMLGSSAVWVEGCSGKTRANRDAAGQCVQD